MMQRSQPKQGRQALRLRQLKYRKLTLAGGNTIVTYNSHSKVRQKPNMVEFPFIENQEYSQQKSASPIDIKLYEQELYRKNNYRAMKALVKVYDQNKKKTNIDTMNVLGLDIRKLHCVPQQSKSALNKKSTSQINKAPFKLQNVSPRHHFHPSSRTQILRKKSQQSTQNIEEDNKNMKNGSLVFIGTEHSNINKLQSVQSAIFPNNPNQTHHPTSAHSASNSPTKKIKIKKQKYLYERLAGKQLNSKEQVNLVYDRRIKSYTDLLFKLQYAHNIYINLDLKPEDVSIKGRRVKYYIGPGNNSAMVRGLMKRRYWWQPCQDIKQCCFVWTQTKVNSIFEKQLPCKIQLQNAYKDMKQSNRKLSGEYTGSYCKTDSFIKQRKIVNQNKQQRQLSPLKRQQQKQNKKEQYNYKIMNQEDEQGYSEYYKKYQKNSEKTRSFEFKVQKLNKMLIQLPLQDSIVHNHVPHNYNLGNKKALFYNLRMYYNLLGQDPFKYIPLTFHIKNGFKDQEYKRFVAYYNRRKNIIKKQIKQIEQQYGQGYQGKKKTRNIWIVKPGQNSNQGRGITVIDEIYQLNSIMKRTTLKKNNSVNSEKCGNICKQEQDQKQTKRTHIVQMYIDRPFLYNNRKFDIRHYMLITNMYGIRRVYWYSEGYIRTSSYQFRIDIFEPEIHLTNDSIQKKYPDYGKYQPYNKISYQEFQRYLDSAHGSKKYSFKNDILPKMKKIAADASKSVCLKISPKNLEHNFEIFGLDFMIDRHFQPWLIQINTNPCLQCNCPLLDRIIPYMVEQSFKLSIDLVYPPPSQYPNTSKHFAPYINLQLFKYELIFDQKADGGELKRLYGVYKDKSANKNAHNRKLLHKMKQQQAQLGQLSDDEWFGDDGKQIKLDDFT